MIHFRAAHLCSLNPVARGDLHRPYHPAEINPNQAL